MNAKRKPKKAPKRRDASRWRSAPPLPPGKGKKKIRQGEGREKKRNRQAKMPPAFTKKKQPLLPSSPSRDLSIQLDCFAL
jgi:hypothetical protein